MHFHNVKILWKADQKNLDNHDNEKVTYPVGSDGPNRWNIEELKNKITAKMPRIFTKDKLDTEYGRLEHPGDSCHYNPFNLVNKNHITESYGLKDDHESGIDSFYSRDMTFTAGDL